MRELEYDRLYKQHLKTISRQSLDTSETRIGIMKRFFAHAALCLLAFVLGQGGVVTAQANPISIKFSELYSKSKTQELSPKLLAANGKRVEMLGYMAPPLKSEIDFFVLSPTPLSICPFCSSAADWPSDIVLVLMRDGKSAPFTNAAMRVRGRLELGVKEDPETGFVSLIRIYADDLEVLKR
jgi:hypothetical protein